MAYSNFTLQSAIAKFGLKVDTSRELFTNVQPITISASTRTTLEQNAPLATLMVTEKAKSELLVAPMIVEVWRRTGHQIAVYSGVDLDVDAVDGLTGTCDFLLARGPQLPYINPPILVLVEAKRDDFTAGYGQCVSEMVAALRLNRRENTDVETVYGVMTNGVTWKFFQLHGTDLAIDLADYSIQQPDRLLGVLMHLVGMKPLPAVAA